MGQMSICYWNCKSSFISRYKKKICLILFLAPIKSGRTILSWVSRSTKEGEGKGKLGQIILIGVSSFGVWIINKCFDENNYDIKQQCKVIVCYLENTSIKHPQYLQLMKYRNKGVSPNTKIFKYELKNIQNMRPIKRTNLQVDFYLAFSKSSREKEAFQQNLPKTENISMLWRERRA